MLARLNTRNGVWGMSGGHSTLIGRCVALHRVKTGIGEHFSLISSALELSRQCGELTPHATCSLSVLSAFGLGFAAEIALGA